MGVDYVGAAGCREETSDQARLLVVQRENVDVRQTKKRGEPGSTLRIAPGLSNN